MADPSVQERLREGIEAARRGDKLTARRLLQQVLIQDRNNEAALMWMASVMDTVAERRAYLERALQVNPRNDRAREALARLGGMPRQAAIETASEAQRRSGANPYLIAAGVVIVLMVIIVGAVLLSGRQQPQNTIDSTFAAAMRGTDTPTPEPTQPTPTFFGIVVTLDPNQVELPPTFTPTSTPEPTATPEPSATPFPIESFPILYSDFEANAAQPSLFAAVDGNEQLLSSDGGFTDVALSPEGDRIAFVRVVTVDRQDDADAEATEAPEGFAGVSLPQLLVASLDNLGEPALLTTMTGDSLTYPSWSPDGQSIVFASNQDGDEELYRVSASGGDVRRLTNNAAIDTAPKFSPDGSLIAYTSDVDSPGFTEIYTYAVEDGTITQLSNDAGNNYAPAWSPDGSRIAYLSTRQGDGDVYVMDADGSRSFQITPDDDGAEDRAPVWSPDGRWIAFASDRESGNFRWFAANVETGEIMMLTSNNRNAQTLIFRPV